MDEQNGTGSLGGSDSGGFALVDKNGKRMGRCQVCLLPAIEKECESCLKGIAFDPKMVAVRERLRDEGKLAV